MQVEDAMGQETAKHNEIVKTRGKQYQDKIDEQRLQLTSIRKDNESTKSELKQQKKE